ncbi:bacillithiol biosynthesis BshC [Bacillus licheniformis]|nr:bacillithiol biosynthesis BshC [Bacillus licheniformis]
MRDFDKIQTSIKPLDAPQERIWNIVYYLNKYGPDFLENTRICHIHFKTCIKLSNFEIIFKNPE